MYFSFFRLRAGAAAIVVVFVALVSTARGQFFIGAPTISANTTSGTHTNTLVAVPNQLTHEIDVTGQLTVTNATPFTQILTFDVSCFLDPTFNLGNASMQTLQVTQSGYVDVPTFVGATINGWGIQAIALDATLNPIPGGFVYASQPIFPLGYGPGAGQIYGPQLDVGLPFNYQPAVGQSLILHFTSDFQGLTVPNTYVWDFPLTVKFSTVPEPGATMLLAAGGMLVSLRRRRATNGCR